MSNHLEIRLFGQFSLHRRGRSLIRRGAKAEQILCRLLLAPGRSLAVEQLIDGLWGEQLPRRPAKALNTELWRLGRWLQDAGAAPAGLLRRNGDCVELVGEALPWVDVLAFDDLTAALAAGAGGRESIALAGRAAALYRGDLLEGVYDDWVMGPREERRRALLDCLGGLAEAARVRDDWLAAASTARRVLAVDPLHEPAQQVLIRSYQALGDRAGALSQYRRFRHRLEQELGVEPSAQTRHLLEQTLPPRASTAAAGDWDRRLDELAGLLSQVVRSLEVLRGELSLHPVAESRRGGGREDRPSRSQSQRTPPPERSSIS